MQKENIIEGRDDAGGHYKQVGWCRKEGIIEGRDHAEREHFRREG